MSATLATKMNQAKNAFMNKLLVTTPRKRKNAKRQKGQLNCGRSLNKSLTREVSDFPSEKTGEKTRNVSGDFEIFDLLIRIEV